MFFRATLIAAAIATAAIGSAPLGHSEPPCYISKTPGDCVPDPEQTPGGAPPPGWHAQCRDGSYSFSEHRSGTCSGHGGVKQWNSQWNSYQGVLMAREPLEWTGDNHAYRDRAHYHAYEWPDGKWNLAVLSMHTDEPGGGEETLGDYRLVTLADAKRLAQGLANLAEADPVNGPGDRTNRQP